MIFLYIRDEDRNLIEIELPQELPYIKKFILINHEFSSQNKFDLNLTPTIGLPVLDIDLKSCAKSSCGMPAIDIYAPFHVYLDETTVEIQFKNIQKYDEVLKFGAILFFLLETELIGVSFNKSLATDFSVDRTLQA